jgi:hypothetical protein
MSNQNPGWDQSVAKFGVTASIGGSALTAGQRATGSIVIPGASALLKQNTSYAQSVGAVAIASPAFAGGPGAGFTWNAYIDDASVTDQVTVEVTCIAAGTPTAGVYAVSLLPL